MLITRHLVICNTIYVIRIIISLILLGRKWIFTTFEATSSATAAGRSWLLRINLLAPAEVSSISRGFIGRWGIYFLPAYAQEFEPEGVVWNEHTSGGPRKSRGKTEGSRSTKFASRFSEVNQTVKNRRVKQGPEEVIAESNKIGAGTTYEFRG